MTHYVIAAGLSTAGVSGWIKSNLIPLILLVVGLGVLWMGRGQNHKAAVRMVGVVFIGLFVIGIAAGGWQTASTDLVKMVGL